MTGLFKELIMNISLNNSALQLFNTSLQKASNAGEEIANATLQNNAVGTTDSNPQSLIKPVVSLKEAEFETSAAAKLLEVESNMIGSILDIKA